MLPHHKGLRPIWLLRLGLFIYDNIGGRKKLPKSISIDLKSSIVGQCLRDNYTKGFEYSDCSVNDSRLVVLNAIDASEYGATIKTQHACTDIKKQDNHWKLTVTNQLTQVESTITAKVLINATGPWADSTLKILHSKQNPHNIRLVQGSHIVVPKLYDHDKCYIFQNNDERITFAVPYHEDYTLIGTTDHEFEGDPRKVAITDNEIIYLCEAANHYFNVNITKEDIVRTYAGVRSLYDDGASKAQEATRDYVLRVDQDKPSDAPLINVFGGKITTYRRLAESMMKKVNTLLDKSSPDWTMHAHLPGGDFAIDDKEKLTDLFIQDYSFLPKKVIERLINHYRSKSVNILGGANTEADLGNHFGHGLYQAEVEYLIKNEWAVKIDDILYRRTKLGLVFNPEEKEYLSSWITDYFKRSPF